MASIIYTHTDEAPMLATASFLPIVQAFTCQAGIDVQTRDISLAGRIMAAFADLLPENMREHDALAELGQLARRPEANIIKLPNISASLPQLKAAIHELQSQGVPLPEYPDSPSTDHERDIRARYDSVKGSAVNPVLREGNSDRRAPEAVKNYAKNHPHSMGAWASDSRTRVATMSSGDFRANEQSVQIDADTSVQFVHIDSAGKETVLKEGLELPARSILDSTVMQARALDEFLAQQVQAARAEGLLFSVHLKATMMKVSDPIIFGHVVRAYFPETFEKYGSELHRAGISANNGLGALLSSIDSLEHGADIKASIEHELAHGPLLAMVNSDQGITNLHVPSDVIIDASMPAMIRNSGKMWGPDGKPADTLAVIPDSSYAGVYETVIEDCKRHGALDPATMGTVPNVGLMAQKAEEYGSHNKTFEISADGRVEVRTESGTVLMSQSVSAGDIFRSCQANDAPIRDWVSLAVRRCRLSGMPAIFWLDEARAHDRLVKEKVQEYLAQENTENLDIQIMDPVQATQVSLDRARAGKSTISATGNVLRDYLTDLFPILEVGTSAKMLSIVPLMAGGGLFETGAGGSAPKHVQQLLSENYLRWDSLGEFLALAESLRQYAQYASHPQAAIMAQCLDRATEKLLNEGKSPSRRLGGIDNRGSHAWLAVWWAQELAQQTDDATLANAFVDAAARLTAQADRIERELIAVQGHSVDLGGYYRPNPARVQAVMRPSATLNAIIDALRS